MPVDSEPDERSQPARPSTTGEAERREGNLNLTDPAKADRAVHGAVRRRARCTQAATGLASARTKRRGSPFKRCRQSASRNPRNALVTTPLAKASDFLDKPQADAHGFAPEGPIRAPSEAPRRFTPWVSLFIGFGFTPRPSEATSRTRDLEEPHRLSLSPKSNVSWRGLSRPNAEIMAPRGHRRKWSQPRIPRSLEGGAPLCSKLRRNSWPKPTMS